MKFPRVVRVRQRFSGERVGDVEAALRRECAREEIARRIRPGMRVAVTAGSRGIAGVAIILRALVRFLGERGAEPFIVPAMGSHGGATAAGQVKVLRSLGITEKFCGAPIRSSMEVVRIGETGHGIPVYMDRLAAGADGVVLVGRIKPHTDFRAEIESGLLKMASIGLGKHEQALVLHSHGVRGIRDFMVEAGCRVLESGRVLFGVGIVENGYDEISVLEAIPPEEIPRREAELLRRAAAMMPKLPVEDVDVLFVDELGKNYSGTGMDTNIIGRFKIPGVEEPESPRVKYLIVSRLSEQTGGNALGVGLADFTTRRLFEGIDFGVTNENVLTSTFVERGKIPPVLESDRAAIEAAIRCNWGVPPEETRFVRIPNTLHLRDVYVSENLLDEALATGGARRVGESEELEFDTEGYLTPFGDS
jgi:hypothetical protein